MRSGNHLAEKTTPLTYPGISGLCFVGYTDKWGAAAAQAEHAEEISQEFSKPAKLADADPLRMATTIHAEAGLKDPVLVDQLDEHDGGDEDTFQEEEPEPVEEPPAPEAQAAAPPTAEEKAEAEREKDRKRFEARRAGRMYFVRHPRAPEDAGAPASLLCVAR